MSEDPFALDQQALEAKLQALQKNFERWREVSSQVGDDGDLRMMSADLLRDELQWLEGEITRSLRNLAWEVTDLQETLTAIQQQQPEPNDISGLYGNRTLFLGNARALLSAIEAEVTRSVVVAAKAAPEARAPAQPPAATSDVDLLLEPVPQQPVTAWRRVSGPLRRYRCPLLCLAVVLGAAFILWVFYEAVLSGAQRPNCTATASSIAEM